MYTVTFYSFKGGVGRSMAMMNTAFALVSEGKKVLVVDFDLEAPGLDTFALPNSSDKNLGVVDFVCDYVKTGTVPEIHEYAFRSSSDDSSGGELWVMPAGRRDEKYADLMNSINWRELYDKRDGYLLFEDLKAQWKKYLKPDYVLIDSRTGHTDEAGICTRQLPDAVVCLFFPNRQNLIGLTRIVNQIRKENDIRKEKFPDRNSIALHFVTSNVPDLDDENSVLEETLSDFETELQYGELAATIHHYPSLALLNQDIFTRDRPKSRLSAEYRQLTTVIQEENPKDKKMSWNDKLNLYWRRRNAFERDVDEHIKKISDDHGKDIDALKSLIELGRSGYYFGEEVTASLIAVQRRILDSSQLNQSVQMLSVNECGALEGIDSWPAVNNLKEYESLSLVRLLSFDTELLPLAELLIHHTLANKDFQRNTDLVNKLEVDLVLNFIGQRKFSEAASICNKHLEENTSNQIALFNRAIATWGKTRQVPVDDFQSVLDLGILNPDSVKYRSANYLQCLSLASWATGKLEEAEEFLTRARLKVAEVATVEFSFWSFLYRVPQIFLKDLDQQEKMFSDKEVFPEVVRYADDSDLPF